MKQAGVVLVAVVCGAASSGCGVAQAQAGKKAKGTQVVTAARDLAPGEVVTFDDLGAELLPAEWELGSSIRPESASSIVNQKVNLPVMKGDVLHWFFFEMDTAQPESVERCRQVSRPGATAADQLSTSRQVILSRAGANHP